MTIKTLWLNSLTCTVNGFAVTVWYYRCSHCRSTHVASIRPSIQSSIHPSMHAFIHSSSISTALASAGYSLKSMWKQELLQKSNVIIKPPWKCHISTVSIPTLFCTFLHVDHPNVWIWIFCLKMIAFLSPNVISLKHGKCKKARTVNRSTATYWFEINLKNNASH